MRLKRLPIALLSLAAMAHWQAAVAAECITEQEVSGLAIFAVPSIVNAALPVCSPHLSPDGYLGKNGGALTDRYGRLGDANWPLAKTALFKFIDRKDSGLDVLVGLPDDAMRPLVEAVLAQKISADIKPQDCPKIERGFQIIDQLPPETVGEVIGFVMGLVKPKNPVMCPNEQP
jgi:hypothetical protein